MTINDYDQNVLYRYNMLNGKNVVYRTVSASNFVIKVFSVVSYHYCRILTTAGLADHIPIDFCPRS